MKNSLFVYLLFFCSNIIAQNPKIHSFNPKSGLKGTKVTIYGANFNGTYINIYFGNVNADSINVINDTTIIATV